ncbi:hypothetical protein ACQP2F_29215 [Actinoplanes sp. CA-030573]|uniref:hypothetical protein n=1 Tax=Actinoplanes sp. CA-030573 TaxID=3239898 RepID=UPI003D8CE2F4
MKKPTKRQWTIIAVVALVLLACLWGRARQDDQHAGLDADGKQACDDFAAGYPKAKTKAERLTLADKVTASSGKTDNKEIQQKAADMGTAASAGGSAWTSSAAALKTACQNAGWTAP